MIYYILAAILILCAMFIGRRLLIFHRYPYYKHVRFEQTKDLFWRLLKNGRHGSFVVIKLDRPQELVLQFFKYVEGDKSALVLDFPLAAWSKPYFEAVMKRIESLNLRHSKHGLEYDDPQSEVKFIVNVDFGEDVERAFQFTQLIFVEVFQARAEDTYIAYIGRANLPK